jgi:hypothetical protein
MSDLRRAIETGSFESFRRTDPRCSLGPRAAEEPTAEDGEKADRRPT